MHFLFHVKKLLEAVDMVAYACKPRTLEAEAEAQEFKAILGHPGGPNSETKFVQCGSGVKVLSPKLVLD